jgi:hypothetical protein
MWLKNIRYVPFNSKSAYSYKIILYLTFLSNPLLCNKFSELNRLYFFCCQQLNFIFVEKMTDSLINSVLFTIALALSATVLTVAKCQPWSSWLKKKFK